MSCKMLRLQQQTKILTFLKASYAKHEVTEIFLKQVISKGFQVINQLIT